MQKITYVNTSGAELVLTNSAPFLLQNFTDEVSVDLYSFKGVKQDGLTYLDNNLGSRDISLELYIIAKSKIELIEYRNKFLKTINPKLGAGFLIYEDDVKKRKIKCLINKIPFFVTVKNSEGKIGSGILSLNALNPYWTDMIDVKNDIARWIGDFEFPLKLNSDGIELSHRELSTIVNVINNGDVECGIRIEFRAAATVVNPELLNISTGDFIKINKTMVAGEKIIINTHFGTKSITSTINGVINNIFNYVDFDSVFLQLNIGDNLIRYNALNGFDNLEVMIYHTPMYLGV